MLLSLSSSVLDLTAAHVQRQGETIPLTRMEVGLLRHLAARPGVAVPKEELLREVWDYMPGLKTRALDSCVLRVRQKLEDDPKNPVHLLTVYGQGYRLAVFDGPGSYGPYQVEATLVAGPTGVHRAVKGNKIVALVTGADDLLSAVELVHSALDHERIPKVIERGNGWLALDCAVRETVDGLWTRLARHSEPALPFDAGTWLAHEIAQAAAHAHKRRDPRTTEPVTVGTFSWNLAWIDDKLEPWMVGWGRTLGPALGPSADTYMVEAPEIPWTQQSSTRADVYGLLSWFEAIPAQVRQPLPQLVRVLTGQLEPGDERVAELLLPLRTAIKAPAEHRLVSVEQLLQRYHQVWRLLGTEPNRQRWREVVAFT